MLPETAMAFDDRTQIPSPTGASLRLYRTLARKPRAVVAVAHGLSEHAGRYAPLAAFLSTHGFHVYAHDHRGHGNSTAPDAPPGSFGSGAAAEKVLADLGAVHG